MGPNWHPVVGCLCLLVSSALSAAVPTPDTIVVARSDDGELATQSTTPIAVTELTTEETSAPIKLTQMEVTSNISLRYAHTAVVTRVRNPARRAQEATFRVLLPETAFISSFTMILDGKPYKAYVKEKEEAKKIYYQAVSQGIGAAHVATKARDSNHFTVSVNVEPNQEAVFELTYEELLTRRNGVYNHAINLHPGTVVPKLTVTVNIRESQKITDLRVPEVRTGNEIDATPEDPQNAMATIVRGQNGRDATITFTPDLEEQQRLMSIYLEKTKETNPSPHRFYGYDDAEEDSKDREGVLGQFVVQYDVERPKDGEILVNDGYFVHFYAPSQLPPLSKHVVFVLDTSGSMMDRKIVQLREAMQTILSELNSGDYFSIVEFASAVRVHELNEADKEPVSWYVPNNVPAKLVPPSAATPDNIAKAKVIVSRLEAAGGTNIYSALDVAVTLIKKGVGWSDKTDAATNDSVNTTAAPDTPTSAPTEPADTKKEIPQLEPIIIFLTDGDPTVGQTDPTRIINHLTEKNSGENRATIYSLAFGEDADRKFLRKLSLRNDGFMRHIYEAADAALQLRDFYRQVASPLLAHVKFVYPKRQVKADSLTKHRFRRYYLGSETVVAGQVEDDVTELTPTVGAFCGVDDNFTRKYLEILPKSPVPVTKDNFLPLERLWAYLTVKQLLDERDARDSPVPNTSADEKAISPDKKALDIALKYSFVTPLTSLVVVKPNASDAVDAESVDKQQPEVGFGAPVPLSSAGGFGGLAGGLAGAPGQPGPLMASFAFARPAPPSAFFPTSVQQQLTSQDTFLPMEDEDGYGEPVEHIPEGIVDRAPIELLGLEGVGGLANSNIDQLYPTRQDEILPIEEEEPEHALLEEHVLSTTPSPVNPLEKFHLQQCPWVASLLVGDQISVPTNSTNTETRLKLSTDSVAPRAAGGKDAACDAAAEGAGGGVCVYLTRCASAAALTADSYPSFHCSVDGYAGVCCPKDKVDVEKKI